MNDKNRISSAEIARLAGVSRATISRVIHNDNRVKAETREKVLEIIEKFNYSPDIAAQMLAGKKTKTIGFFVVIQDDDTGVDFGFEDTHMLNMIFEIIRVAALRGYFVLVDIVYQMNNKETDQKIKEMFIQRRIDGGIFMNFQNEYPLIETLVEQGFIIGVLDQDISEKTEVNRIVVNYDEKPMEKAVDYLVGLGHKDIMGIHGNISIYSGDEKHKNFIKAMKKHQLIINESWQLFTDFNKEQAYKVMVNFLKENPPLPSAICCGNDNIALGVMVALKEYGLKIPEDISVTGSDDASFAKRLKPKLTTCKVDFRLVLDTLTNKVIDCIERPFTKQFTMKFGSEFIERTSCMKS